MNASSAQTAQPITGSSCVITGKRVIDRRPVEVLPKPGHQTARLVFRLLTPSDEQAFIEALDHSRSEVRRWIPVNHDDESASHFFHRTMTKARVQDIEGTAWRRGVFIERGDDAGKFLGMFNLIKIQRGREWSCEANWWVDTRLAGKGHGSEAAKGMIDYALGDHPNGLGMHLVRGYICKDNPGSIRVANKCGFNATGGRELLEVNKALIQHEEFECWAS